MSKIVFVHLLNDVSGSPRVLLSAISALSNEAKPGCLFVGSDGNGCLTSPGVPVFKYWYRRTGNKFLTLFTYFFSQFFLFWRLLLAKGIDRDAVVYCNTLLPFGAALYGWLTKRKVIYHIHEISITPPPLKWLLVGFVKLTSSLNVYVSTTHAKALPIQNVPIAVVPNALSDEFVARAQVLADYRKVRAEGFRVLMVASLRDYKGVPELLKLANEFSLEPNIKFDLLVNDEQEDIDKYFRDKLIPRNLTVHSRVSDTIPFYTKASLVLNLSRVDMWVETFGLTIVEAMAFGIPVIVPPVGGPTELVEDGVEGYLIDSRDLGRLKDCVARFLWDEELCFRCSDAGLKKSLKYGFSSYRLSLNQAVFPAD